MSRQNTGTPRRGPLELLPANALSFRHSGCIAARWATVLNVSQHGIGLLLPIKLDPGTEVVVELPCQDLTNLKVVVAHVVHANFHNAGSWAIGCTLRADSLRKSWTRCSEGTP